jgi:hypothetical protein
MADEPSTSRPFAPGLLRSPRFDLALVGGALLLALLAGVVVVRWPQLLALVLLADLWLLSYHHVIATFTRLAFDGTSFREHRFLVLGVPVLVVAATVTAVKLVGLWVVPTVYFYWQWWHYARQSYGISRIYQLRSGRPQKDRLGNAMLFLVALVGVLHRSAQGWPRFLGAEVRLFPVPPLVVGAAGVAAAVAVVLWLGREVRRARAGQPGGLPALYLGSHVVLFGVAYLGINQIDVGWLVINVWHNAQYLLLVWMYNSNRFRGGVSPAHRLLSWISQAHRWPVYVAVCLLVTTALYGGLAAATAALASSSLPALVIAYQVINFHHYIADAVIWKVRRKPVQQALGIAA